MTFLMSPTTITNLKTLASARSGHERLQEGEVLVGIKTRAIALDFDKHGRIAVQYFGRIGPPEAYYGQSLGGCREGHG